MKKHKVKTLILVDTFSIYGFHEMFNAAFLFVVLNNTRDNIVYIADYTAIASIKRILKEDDNFSNFLSRITFKEQKLVKGNTFYEIFFRLLIGAFLNSYYLMKYQSSKIIFNSLNPISASFMRFLISKRNLPVYIVCHGELSYPTLNKGWKSPIYWYGKMLKPFLTDPLPENMKLFLLGNSILSNVETAYPAIAPNLIAINHPFIFTKASLSSNSTINDIKCFGWVGVVSEAKGFLLFNEITKYFYNNFPEKFSPYIVGRHNLDEDNYPHLNFISKRSEFVDRVLFDDAVGKLDFILFFYDNEQYKFTASGAVFDAIQYGKIIIALKNNYFEEIFNKCGEIGVLCNNMLEIQDVIEGFLTNKISCDKFYINLRKAKEYYDYNQQIIHI